MSHKDLPVLLVVSPATCGVLPVLVSLIHADDSLRGVRGVGVHATPSSYLGLG
jgi:hypothetical protein